MIRFASATALVVALMVSAAAQAVPVVFEITGTVGSVDSGNVYGLAGGDAVAAIAHFDDSLITPAGGSDIELGTSGNAFGGLLRFDIGTQAYIASLDLGYLTDIFPLLEFWNGAFSGFDFMASDGVNGAPGDFGVNGLYFYGENGLNGWFDLQTVSITARNVAEPATLALGLLAVTAAARCRRRRRSSWV